MGMSTAVVPGTGEPETLVDVNTTPLIDVMLVLLVMLIITVPMQFHSINLDIGRGTPPTQTPVVHVVSIDFDGTVAWDGQPLSDQAAVQAKLHEVGALPLVDQPELHIKPNKLVDYSAVAAVMAAVQRSGAQKMAVIGNEAFNR